MESEAKENTYAIWIRLPQLPTEFYDHHILARVGHRMGKLVKTDICTSQVLRGRYARIHVEVEPKVPVKKVVYTGEHIQEIV